MTINSHTDIILAGAAAAFTVDMLIYPLDTLKTRQQSRDFLSTKPSRHLFRGLYQGVGIVVIATLPAAGAFFTVYEASKTFLSRHVVFTDKVPQPVLHSAASAIAECASCLILTPAEVVKQNAQVLQRRMAKHQRSTSLQALRQLVRGTNTGRRLLSGYTALVARNLPFTALQFPIFEFARAELWGRRSRSDPDGERGLSETAVVTGISAAVAGSIAALVTTPMDVVKTRMMLTAGNGEGREAYERAEMERRGGLAIARRIVAERGVRGLFRGATLRSVWTALGSGLYLGMYEVAKVWLGRGKESDEDNVL